MDVNNSIMKTLRFILSVALCLSVLSAKAGDAVVKTGIEVLESRAFEGLVGKRVALLTNPSGVDRQLRSTIDILYNAPGVNLVALLAPEHGVRGDVYAGASIDDFTDPATGCPVYALYGRTRKPTPEMLKGVDVVVYDIQDVGSRTYTFISAMGMMMQACAEQGVEVMVLDRPNPLGGLKVEGNLVRPGHFSYIGMYPIPYVYGLTVGEVAKMINEEYYIRGEKGTDAPVHCKLTVIPMEGWHRWMKYSDTNLPWVLPSPQVPTPESAIGYPSSGIVGDFFGYLNIGIGYTLPFCTFAAEWVDAEALKAELETYNIPGTAFRTIHYKPFFGDLAGKLLHGVQYYYTDYEKATITLTQFYVMQAIHELYPERQPFGTKRDRSFDLDCGTDFVRNTFSKSFKVSDIYDFWTAEVEGFKKLSAAYYLYD